MAKKAKKGERPIVIRREEIVAAGHHGGAWKVAYADFVTAMMAFFLLMWLINATTEKQRRGLADYFSPAGPPTRSMSGSGKPFGGLTLNENGSLVSNRGYVSNTDQSGRPPPEEQQSPESSPGTGSQPDRPGAQPDHKATNKIGVSINAAPQTDPDAVAIEGSSNQSGAAERADADQDGGSGAGDATAPATDASNDAVIPVRPKPTASIEAGKAASAGSARLTQAANEINQALQSTPAMREAAHQVAVDVTPDELRIQIYDAEHKPMFDAGATEPNERARRILAEVAPVLARLGEPVSIVGHTDASPCVGRCRSNWDLSAARAESTRAALVAGGLRDEQIAGVAGLADHDLLLPAQPESAANRRVVMIVHRHMPGFASATTEP